MMCDYYQELGLPRSATLQDIRHAYRTLALKFHPDRAEDAAASQEKFTAICESYDVLSQAQLRTIFDHYGYEGLHSGVPKEPEGFTEPYVFHADAQRVFHEFFGGANPYADLFPADDEYGVRATPEGPRTRRVQEAAVVRDLAITMEEAYCGCVKKMKMSRKVMNEDGHTSTMRDKILTVNVKPGWKEGTRVTFAKDGDQGPNKIPADVVFVIKYKTHPRFTREGNNLVHTAKISLCDALIGCIIEILMLDGRKLNIPVNDTVRPAYEKIVPGEGMPITSKAGGGEQARGDLVLRFDIEFPPNLAEHKKVLIRQAFQD